MTSFERTDGRWISEPGEHLKTNTRGQASLQAKGWNTALKKS